MDKNTIEKLELGKKYWFKLSNRKKRIKGILTSKDSIYTGLSVYHGTDAIEFKRKYTTFTAVLYGIESITEA